MKKMEIEEIEKLLEEGLKNSVALINNPELKNHEFEFVKRSILNALEYFTDKRENRNVL